MKRLKFGVFVITLMCISTAHAQREQKSTEEMFKQMDRDSDGNVSVDEYKQSKIGIRQGDEAESKFMEIDSNNDGTISLVEFKSIPKLNRSRG
ncbi:MAG: Ca2+-binding EF-hand superfamily protein [Crocinitomix sp.]|jgi:Ca2+-binding EF-hand superfamily protein